MKSPFSLTFTALCFFATILAAAEPAAPAASPAATATPYPHYDDTGVSHVRNPAHTLPFHDTEPGAARRGDVIWITVNHLNNWLKDPQSKDRFPKDAKTSDLVPFLNDVALPGLHPEQVEQWNDLTTDPPTETTYLRFTLRRTESSKNAWTQILNRPDFARPMQVSIGFENGEAMRTWVLPGAIKSENQFIFTLIPPLRFCLGVALILGAFIAFLYLARWTEIIRDVDGPMRPDKRWPYSLSRAQMAFWFFLVVSAFFFLWVIIGDMDTLNPSVLGLIGISAGTALGATFADSAKTRKPPVELELPAVNLSQPRPQICIEIARLLATAREQLHQTETKRASFAPADEVGLAANAAAQAKMTAEITALEQQLDYFQWPAWKGVMYDLLAEDNVVCFHRFQMFVWTIVLGMMFVANVYNELAMPEFSATLLGLLGISAGTYVGYKIPEKR